MKMTRIWMVLGVMALLCALGCVQAEESGQKYAECDDETGECPAVAAVETAAETKEKIPEFVPTEEWQQVKQGQSIPPGLHVRMNLETGVREAKLIAKDENEEEDALREAVPVRDVQVDMNKKIAAVITVATDVAGDISTADSTLETPQDTVPPETSEENSANTEELSASETSETPEEPEEPEWNDEMIYDVLKALPEPPKVQGMDINEARERLSQQEFRLQMIKLWKQRQIDLKEAMAAMQDDATYFGKLLTQLQAAAEEGSVTEQLKTLEVLEWEVGDLDKTQVFNFVGGFQVVTEFLNATNLPVRAHASWLLGTAVKNYKEAQDWAVSAGVIPKLLDMLSYSAKDPHGWTVSEIFEAQKKTVYALSALVRFNTRAQRLFFSLNGPEALASLFAEGNPANLQLKSVLLAHDLLLESVPTDATASEGEDSSVLPQLHSIFRSAEWCQHTSKFFIQHATQHNYSPASQVLQTLHLQLPACQAEFAKANVKDAVQSLQTQWRSAPDLDHDERQELIGIADKLLQEL